MRKPPYIKGILYTNKLIIAIVILSLGVKFALFGYMAIYSPSTKFMATPLTETAPFKMPGTFYRESEGEPPLSLLRRLPPP